MPVTLLVMVGLLGALLAGALGGTGGYLLAQREDSQVIDPDGGLPTAPQGTVERPADSVAGVANRLLPSVVQIAVRTGQGSGTGSGFVIRQDGYVLTNNHVVRAAAQSDGEIAVKFSDGKTTQAKVVGRSRRYDLAVVKVDRRNLPAMGLANSDSVVVGD